MAGTIYEVCSRALPRWPSGRVVDAEAGAGRGLRGARTAWVIASVAVALHATVGLAAGRQPFVVAAANASVSAVTKTGYEPQDVAIYALGMIGVDYRFGGTTPARGLDCSGLVRHVFQQVTGTTLPRTAREQAALGEAVALDQLRPGDLVFFNTLGARFSHVGIYVGDKQFVHAPHRGAEVERVLMTEPYWTRRFDGGRRITLLLPSLEASSPSR